MSAMSASSEVSRQAIDAVVEDSRHRGGDYISSRAPRLLTGYARDLDELVLSPLMQLGYDRTEALLVTLCWSLRSVEGVDDSLEHLVHNTRIMAEQMTDDEPL